jgi:hypothetical protein
MSGIETPLQVIVNVTKSHEHAANRQYDTHGIATMLLLLLMELELHACTK